MANERYYLNDRPQDRLSGPTGDDLTDQIYGILVGFAKVLSDREGHIDVITLNDSAEEIRDLIRKQGGNA